MAPIGVPDLNIIELILRYDDFIKGQKKTAARALDVQSSIWASSIMDALESPDGTRVNQHANIRRQ